MDKKYFVIDKSTTNDINDQSQLYIMEKDADVKTILADGAYNNNEYDNNGVLTASTNYIGVHTTYEYDNEDCLIKQTTGSDKIEYTYDE